MKGGRAGGHLAADGAGVLRACLTAFIKAKSSVGVALCFLCLVNSENKTSVNVVGNPDLASRAWKDFHKDRWPLVLLVSANGVGTGAPH